MSDDDPQIREPMGLEYVHRWMAPEVSSHVDNPEVVGLRADASMADQQAAMPGGR